MSDDFPRRILFVNTAFWLGGTEQQLAVLAQRLAARGWSVSVMGLEKEGPLVEVLANHSALVRWAQQASLPADRVEHHRGREMDDIRAEPSQGGLQTRRRQRDGQRRVHRQGERRHPHDRRRPVGPDARPPLRPVEPGGPGAGRRRADDHGLVTVRLQVIEHPQHRVRDAVDLGEEALGDDGHPKASADGAGPAAIARGAAGTPA